MERDRSNLSCDTQEDSKPLEGEVDETPSNSYTDDWVPKIKRIIVHYGPLSTDHPAYIGSLYNLLVEWDDGRYSTEALDSVIQDDLALVVQYSVDCKLLGVETWTSQLPEHVRRQLPIVLSPNKSNATFRQDLQHCKAIAQAVRNSCDECSSYNDNESCRFLRDGVCEVFLDADKNDTQCYEKIVDNNRHLFQRCLANRKKQRTKSSGHDGKKSTSDHPLRAPHPDIISGLNVSNAMDITTNASEDDPSAISLLARQSMESVKAFATRTALQDPRIQRFLAVSRDNPHRDASPVLNSSYSPPNVVMKGFEFGNFSLLASRPKMPAQFRHVDTYDYEMQFGMTVTSKSEGTETYIVLDPLETPEQVMELWSELARAPTATWHSSSLSPSRTRKRQRSSLRDSSSVSCTSTHDTNVVTDNLLKAMRDDDTIVCWIQQYGKVLCRPHRMIPSHLYNEGNTWEAGTLVSLPGGAVHCAPRNGKFRVVLFFTGTPSGKMAYRANDQFTGPTLTATIAHRLWDKVGDAEREFLSLVLHQSIMEDPAASESIDFASYLNEEIGSYHEIGEMLREAQEAKCEWLKTHKNKSASRAIRN